MAWTAREQRILLTHDVTTITRYAYDRIWAIQPMPGVFEINRQVAIGTVIEDLLLLTESGLENEREGQILYLPLR